MERCEWHDSYSEPMDPNRKSERLFRVESMSSNIQERPVLWDPRLSRDKYADSVCLPVRQPVVMEPSIQQANTNNAFNFIFQQQSRATRNTPSHRHRLAQKSIPSDSRGAA
mmetsp:Transcript_129403/g.362259  ORF Transcript_129403/g.362259 Transcript_129403/m.362259 type:complete len:111 (+) Transcript_129403:497-829(+)